MNAECDPFVTLNPIVPYGFIVRPLVNNNIHIHLFINPVTVLETRERNISMMPRMDVAGMVHMLSHE